MLPRPRSDEERRTSKHLWKKASRRFRCLDDWAASWSLMAAKPTDWNIIFAKFVPQIEQVNIHVPSAPWLE